MGSAARRVETEEPRQAANENEIARAGLPTEDPLVSSITPLVRALVAAEVQQALAADAAAEVMNADDLAAFLGVDRKTVYDYANRGHIPHQRLGKRLLFSRAAIVSWLGHARSRRLGKE